MTKRILIHIAGLFFLAFGIASISLTELGAAPLDALNKFLSEFLTQTLNQTVTFGTVIFITNAILALVVLIAKRDWKVLISLITSAVLSAFIDTWVFGYELIGLTLLSSIYVKVIINIIAIGVVVIATSILILNDLILSPYDEFVLYITSKVKTYKQGRTIVDMGLLILAIIVGLVLNYRSGNYGLFDFKNNYLYTQISLFTIILIVILPPLINNTTNFLKNRIQRSVNANETK